MVAPEITSPQILGGCDRLLMALDPLLGQGPCRETLDGRRLHVRDRDDHLDGVAVTIGDFVGCAKVRMGHRSYMGMLRPNCDSEPRPWRQG